MPGPYTRYISIGHACQPAYNIRNILYQQEAYFFDWLVTPIPTITKLYKGGGLQTLFDNKSAFKIVGGHKQNAIVTHEELGVIFYHDFPLISGLGDFDKVRSKYQFLAQRQDMAIKNGRTLLVRHHGEKAEIWDLQIALHQAYPTAEIEILVVNEGQPSPSWGLDRIINTTINPSGDDWKGDITGWSRILRKYSK